MVPGIGDCVEVLACSYGSRDIFIGRIGEVIAYDETNHPAVWKVRLRFEWATQVWWFKPSELKVIKKGIEMIPPKLNSRYVTKAFWIGHKKMLEEKITQLEKDCKDAGRDMLLALCDGEFDMEQAIYWHEQCKELFSMYMDFKEELEKVEGIVGAEDERFSADQGTIQK